MGIRVRDTDQYVLELDLRMPFHFGGVEVATATRTVVEATVDVDGETATGLAMGTIGSQWFLKDPSLSLSELVETFLDVTGAAREHAVAVGEAPTVFAWWQDCYARQREWADGTEHPPLLWGYGVALLEQAVVDAFCRARETTFHEAVHGGALGLDLGAVYDDLAGAAATDLLPDEPLERTAVRHTVGQTDPLVAADVDDRLDDGLPQTVADYVASDGVHEFKVKLAADVATDRERLRRFGTVLADQGLEAFAFTLDANEGYADAGAFREQWTELAADPALADLFEHLRYVEQPLPRDEAFTDATRQVLTGWDGPPVIIDESDDRPDRLATALDCGYAGTSHKNSKGVFKGVANACLIEHRRRTDDRDREYVLSGEDLTTIGPIGLHQDLAVTATLGLDHVERNGHHYFRGLSMYPEDLQAAVLEAHPDLYRRHDRGFVTLDVREGVIDHRSVVEAAFGRAVEVDPARFIPLSEWSTASLPD